MNIYFLLISFIGRYEVSPSAEAMET